MHLARSVGVVMMLRHSNPPMRWRPHHGGGRLYDVCLQITGLVITPMLWRAYVMRSANALARMCLSGCLAGDISNMNQAIERTKGNIARACSPRQSKWGMTPSVEICYIPTPHPRPCASTLKVRKTTVRQARMIRQARACARRSVPKERMSSKKLPILHVTTGH